MIPIYEFLRDVLDRIRRRQRVRESPPGPLFAWRGPEDKLIIVSDTTAESRRQMP